MVNYTVSTAALLAITCLSATSINAEGRQTTSTVRTAVDEVEQQRLRKLYGVAASTHFVTDVETKCEEVLSGNPKVCVKVCVEVTSIKSGVSVVEETSKVSESKCEVSSVSTASDWEGDGYAKVEVKNDSWKCEETGSWSAPAKRVTVKNDWSAPASIAKVRPAEAPAKSAKISGKGGLRVSNASWGGGGRNLMWGAPAQVQVKVEPAKPKISNVGWGAAAKVSDIKKKVEKKKEVKTKVNTASAWSAPAKIKKVVSTSSAWSAPARVPAPTICIESTPTPAPTTCEDRYSTWYYNGEKCVNDDSMSGLVGEFDLLLECCEAYFTDDFCKYEDKCCSMNNHVWYYNEGSNVCTNDGSMVGNVGAWDSDFECCGDKFGIFPCPVTDVCIPEEPETILTATPTAAPTTCEDLYSSWYFDPSNGKCVSGQAGFGGVAFSSVDACCGAKYPGGEDFEYCMEFLNVDMCCVMKYEAWYFNGAMCTNDPSLLVGIIITGEMFDSATACCQAAFEGAACIVSDICIPVPPETTVEPSEPEVTDEPSKPEILTFQPSPAPSFGSTPTVSKETTGPPTSARGGRN